MTKNELLQLGLIPSEGDVDKLAHGYASRIERPLNELDFKQKLADAYLTGAELIIDFYLEHR